MADRDLPNALCDYTGVIRDQEIRTSIEHGYLLAKDTFDLSGVRQASCELRLGNTVEFLVLTEPAAGQALAKYDRPANGIDEILVINPGQTVKVFTREILDIPTNVVAHVTPVGNIYKLGLSPETTYADPGFDGEFYITLCNYSTRVVELALNQPIARIEFVKLARSTAKPHPGAKSVREPPRWPKRVSKRSADALRHIGVDQLLTELESEAEAPPMDPLNYVLFVCLLFVERPDFDYAMSDSTRRLRG